MRTTLGLVLLLVVTALAGPDQEKTIVGFRLQKDPTSPMRGYVLRYDDEGFDFQAFDGRKMTIPWSDLVDRDASGLRQRFGLDLSEDERLGLIPGHEIHFRGGGSVRGFLEGIEEETGRHWMRVEGLRLPYPKDRIDRVVELKVKEADVYSADQVYVRRLQRTPPDNAIEHRRLGDYLYDIGSWEGAEQQYNFAIEKDPKLRGKLEERLAELREYMEDQAAAQVYKKAKKLGNLDGKYAEAIELVKNYYTENPGAKRRGIRLIEELEEKYFERKRATFHRIKNEEFDRTVRRYLARMQPDMATARSWVTSELPKDLETKIRERMQLTGEEWEEFSGSDAPGSPHFATYAGGSFVISKRAKKGSSSKRAVRGDPEDWWSAYRDVNTRSTWLKAYAAERLDIFQVVYIRNQACARCGGTGQVRKMSFKEVEGVGHEWRETCPRCYGAREDRGVAYK